MLLLSFGGSSSIWYGRACVVVLNGGLCGGHSASQTCLRIIIDPFCNVKCCYFLLFLVVVLSLPGPSSVHIAKRSRGWTEHYVKLLAWISPCPSSLSIRSRGIDTKVEVVYVPHSHSTHHCPYFSIHIHTHQHLLLLVCWFCSRVIIFIIIILLAVVLVVYSVCKMISFAGTAGYRGQQQQQKATSKQKHTKLPYYIADYFVCVRGWIDDCTDIASDSAAVAVDETFIPSAALLLPLLVPRMEAHEKWTRRLTSEEE